jgi:homospermidine synthase
MRGENLKNIYIIESVEYEYKELSENQKKYIETIVDRKKYNDLRNQILKDEGDNMNGIIKINFPEQSMRVYDEYGILLNEIS